VTLFGIFVGGLATRMGGAPKGLLVAPGGDEPIVQRLARLSRDVEPDSQLVLVGRSSAYAGLDLPSVVDDPEGVGPLGGLSALLGAGAAQDAERVVALACDLPYVTRELIQRLLVEAPGAPALAPRPDGIWQPFFARYAPVPALSAARTAIDSGNRSLHAVLERLGAAELGVSAEEAAALRDWDEPADIRPSRP
jgi:molybdenum cofactor guanylyltransferase